MLKSLNTAATGMQAQQTQMDTIANNIANSATTGFKRSRAEFEDLMYQTQKEPGAATGLNSISPTGVQTGLGVRTASTQKDFEVGSAKMTKNPLDLQIEGAGFFQVQLPDGNIGYTRNGEFHKSAEGKIVDHNGHTLIPELTIPPNAMGISISAQGEVAVMLNGTGEPQVLGQIQTVNFVNPAGLRSMGKNIFQTSPASGVPVAGTPGQDHYGSLAQGQLEMSNVSIVDEMVNMISAQRAYETNSKVIQASDQMLQTINNVR